MDVLSEYRKYYKKVNQTTNQPYIDSFVNNIIYSFEYSPSYFKVTKYPENKTEYDAWILEVKSDEEKDGIQKKQIILKPNQKLNYGDYFNWQNEIWLTVDKSISPYYDNGNLHKCNNYLKFKAYDGTIQNIPCVTSFLNRDYLNIQTNNELMTPKDVFVCKVQKNEYTEQIIESMRFIIDKKAWKVIATTSLLVKDIIEIKIQSDLLRKSDDLINGLADQSVQLTQTPTNLTIQGNTSLKVNTTGTYNVINYNTNESFNFTIVDAITNLPTSYATIISNTNASAILKSANIGGKQIKLIATDSTNKSIVVSMIINISSGF